MQYKISEALGEEAAAHIQPQGSFAHPPLLPIQASKTLSKTGLSEGEDEGSKWLHC